MKARSQTGLILAALTLIGSFLRLWHLGTQSLWLDEGATVALARASWPHFAWMWWHGEANLQTIYFLLMRVWIHGGMSEAWLRLPSALFGIAAIPLIYVVARKFTSAPAALAASALLAFSPTHVYFSQEARSYTLAIVLVLLSTYLFVLVVESNRPRDWVLWALCGIAVFYSHDFAALVLGAQAVSLLFKTEPVPYKRAAICGCIIFLAAVPGLTYVFRASPENLHFAWMPHATPREIWHLGMFFGGSGAKLAVALALWIPGVYAIFRSKQAEAPDALWRGILVLLWATFPAAILGLLSLREPIFLQRYMVFSLPATIILAALGMEVLSRWRIGLLLVVALCGMSLPTIYKQYRKPGEDWRGAANVFLTSNAADDAVVFFPFYTRIMLDYYRDCCGPAGVPAAREFAPGFYAGGENARDLLAILDRAPHQFRHVWIFVSHRDESHTFDERPVLESKLHAIFGDPVRRRFAGIDLLEYGN